VIGDLISPFKAVIDTAYRQVEERLHGAVRLRFGLPAQLPMTLLTRIKKADQVAAYFEAVRLAGFSDTDAARYFGRPGGINVDAIASILDPWPAKRAESLYLKAFKAVAKAAAEELA
jgi:5'-deoxynucleotidase YfbR-like HD superfamily hydrolase